MNEEAVKRQIVISPIEGETVTTSKGLVDPRLWKGGNEVYAEMDPTNCMWRLRYKFGAVPPQISGTYSNFKKAFETAVQYYKTRGLQAEVKGKD